MRTSTGQEAESSWRRGKEATGWVENRKEQAAEGGTWLLEREVFFLEDFFWEFLGAAGCRGEFWERFGELGRN